MREAGVVVLLEDLHWADPSSLVAIHRLGQRSAELRLLLLCTLRPFPERRELRTLLASLDAAGASRLELDPLAADAVRALVREVAGAPPSDELLRRLDAAAGNPLFVIELLRGLRDDGALEISRDGTADTRAGGPPPSMRGTA